MKGSFIKNGTLKRNQYYSKRDKKRIQREQFLGI